MALARLLMSEVRRYPELINASKPKGFPRELLANWLDSPVVRARFAIEDADDAADNGGDLPDMDDQALADLARRHRLPELAPLARWGSWQAAYPHLGCGKKRGFSYFHHRPGKPFRDTLHHASSLLVAASATDAGSDTHWLRADVDTFFCASAARAGAIRSFPCPGSTRAPEGRSYRAAAASPRA
jgi:FADH2 O2-dependent halogenase